MNNKGKNYRISKSTMLSDVLRVLVTLQPEDPETLKKILKALHYKVVSSQDFNSKHDFSDLSNDESEIDHLPEVTKLPEVNSEELNQEKNLPPIITSEIEKKGDDKGKLPPEWLENVSLIPLPDAVPSSLKKPSYPLFEPRWQRALITHMASIILPLGYIDIETIIHSIASGRPLIKIPRKLVKTTAKGIQLLVDQSQSMEPFRYDSIELVHAFKRTLGTSRVLVQTFRGIPDQCHGAAFEWVDYVPPSDRIPVVVVSDLGLVPYKIFSSKASLLEWKEFFNRFNKLSNACVVIVPNDNLSNCLANCKQIKLIPWSRRTLVSRISRNLSRLVIKEHSAEEKENAEMRRIKKLNELGNLSNHAFKLACICSLAIRIEPQLIRLFRLEFIPDAPVEVEAELWFSELMEERAASGIVLRPYFREILLRFIRHDRVKLEYIHKILKEFHRHATPLIRLEEDLTYFSLTGNTEEAKLILRQLIATIVHPQRKGISIWASRALLRLPKDLLLLEEAQILALGTAMRIGEMKVLEKIGGMNTNGSHWLLPQKHSIDLGVNLRQGMIELGPRTIKATHLITVPDDNFVILEITYDGQTEQRRINPRVRTIIPIAGETLEIHVIGAGRWCLFKSKLKASQSTESIQKKIARIRAPRVQIEYDVELYGAEKKAQLPFVLGVMADLSGKPAEALPEVGERDFLEFDIDNFNERMKAIKPRVAFAVPSVLTGEGYSIVDITFESMDDFSPGKIAEKVDALKQLLKARTQLSNLVTYMDGKTVAEKSIHDVIKDETLLKSLGIAFKSSNEPPETIDERIKTKTENREATSFIEEKVQTKDSFEVLLKKEYKFQSKRTQEETKSAERTFWAELAQELTTLTLNDAIKRIISMIAEIDQVLSKQVNFILHHADFQKLEGSWRGLHHLVNNTETDEMLKIKVLDITKREIHRALKKFRGEEWEQSSIFKKIYKHEFEEFGGEPYGCLIGDYEFDNSPPDVEFLNEISKICAAAHVPFIAAASPKVMSMDSWQELADPRDLTKIFSTPDYAAWRALRESPDACYIGLTLPRFLSRLPYGAKTSPVEEFNFEEDITYADHSKYTWSNSAYAMGVNINRAFKLYGWCSSIRGIEAGGAVEGLPTYAFPTDDGGVDMKCPTEVAISDRREFELANNGFIPLLHRKNSDFAAFVSAQSLQKPFEYDDPDATTNANMAARLPYLFAVCRFAHYLKCIARDMIGSFRGREKMEAWLQKWINNYVLDDPANVSQYDRARKPLAKAEVVVEEVEGNPGYYTSKFYLRPHYQLEGLTVSLRLVSRLPIR